MSPVGAILEPLPPKVGTNLFYPPPPIVERVMEGDGLRAEGKFLVSFGLCRGRLENRVLETALFSFCSAHDNHGGGV